MHDWLPQDFFKHLDILVFVEGTIYQLDEDNEALAGRGLVEPARQLLGEKQVVGRVCVFGVGMPEGVNSANAQICSF